MFQSSDIRLRVKVSTKKEELINVKTFHVGKARISFIFCFDGVGIHISKYVFSTFNFETFTVKNIEKK